MSKPPSRFAAYRTALNAVSARTGTPLPSLIVSFGILHELTAILPVIGAFYASRHLGLGEQLVTAMTGDKTAEAATTSGVLGSEDSWLKSKGRVWMEEGEQWAGRIGRRYGIWGFEKRMSGESDGNEVVPSPNFNSEKLAGDVANAVVAYAFTKVGSCVEWGIEFELC
ncbi:hypothetical protein HGRIS_002057 [Hohenbuehelia grisea]|uniref:Uncharacterized protein n=1 Tax=Hohenbuehelia grisea TaxID=104357 RepID=A0ABR3JL52_9AGAR